MSTVRTVTGDVDPADLGPTYAHEHLILDSPVIATDFAHIHLPSVEEATAEVARCREAGVGAMVDAMPGGQGRDVARLARVSARTGVAVVAVTGLHLPKYDVDEWTRRPEAWEERFVADLTAGADGTDHRCGVVKVATDLDGLTERARALFEAAATAHHRTGAPILTHCQDGRGGLEQVAALVSLGVPAEAVALSHTDKVTDLGYHRDLADTGAYRCFDQALRQDPAEPRGTAWLIASLAADDHADRLLLGTDGARRSLWVTLGGAPGLAWLATGFRDALAARGIGEATWRRLTIIHPAAWLTWRHEPRVVAGVEP